MSHVRTVTRNRQFEQASERRPVSPEWSAGYWAARQGQPEQSGQSSEYRFGYSSGNVMNDRLALVEAK